MADFRTVHSASHHLGWDRDEPPVLELAPGATVRLELLDASRGRITRDADADRVHQLAPENANPLTGPIRIDGAEPGDRLCVDILDLQTEAWGWTALIPGFGLLADDFADPWLNISTVEGDRVHFVDGIALPCRPFLGTLGVAPAEAGRHPAIPPLPCGGNMDLREIVRGSRVQLPVQVDGALFSAGDGHLAQGHGEVCGTAVETRLAVELRFSLEKDSPIPHPLVEAPATPVDTGPRLITTGIGPELMDAARDAVRFMIDELERRYRLPPELAYALVSTAADLVVAELVNAPNWTVACSLPTAIFT